MLSGRRLDLLDPSPLDVAAIVFECLTGTAAFPFQSGDNAIRLIQDMIGGSRPSR